MAMSGNIRWQCRDLPLIYLVDSGGLFQINRFRSDGRDSLSRLYQERLDAENRN